MINDLHISGKTYKTEILVTVIADNVHVLAKDGQLPIRTLFSQLLVTKENFDRMIVKMYGNTSYKLIESRQDRKF